MSITLAEKPPASPESGLVESLGQGARAARRSGRSLRLAGLQARLEAMRLMPPPADPKKALGRAAEGAAQAARAVIARMRRSVKPGGREDRLMAELDTGPAAAGGGPSLDPVALDLLV